MNKAKIKANNAPPERLSSFLRIGELQDEKETEGDHRDRDPLATVDIPFVQGVTARPALLGYKERLRMPRIASPG